MIVIAGPVRHRRLVLQPGETIAVEAADWADTLVVVLRGELELSCYYGGRATFAEKAVLTLDGMLARTVHNPGTGELVVHLVHRDR